MQEKHFLSTFWTLTFLSFLLHSKIGVQGSSSGQSTSVHGSRAPYCRLSISQQHYYPGDVWYPTAKTAIGAYCIRCICLATGKLNCSEERCPTDCDGAGQDNPCCRSCKANPAEDSTPSTTIIGPDGKEVTDRPGRFPNQTTRVQRPTNLETSSSNEYVDEDTEYTETPEVFSCLHQGKIYKDGDTFTANVTGLPIASVDQCMQCKCEAGMVLCAMKSCSSFKCSLIDSIPGGGGSSTGSTSNTDTCCQRCAVWKKPRTYKPPPISVNHGITPAPPTRKPSPISTNQNNNNQNQDKTPGFLRTSGNTNTRVGWVDSSPLTLESTVSFSDVTSVNSALGTGREGRRPVDDCISSGSFYMHGATWHPIIGPFGTMECVTCKCNHGLIECNRLKCPARRELSCSKPVKLEGHCCPVCASQVDQPVVDEGNTMCVSGKQDITVFKSFGTGLNGSELIEFAFLRPKKIIGSSETQIERHEWKLKDGDIDEFTTQYLSVTQFDNLHNRNSFVLLGATNEKNVEKFTRREKKLEKRCTSRCSIRISSLERSLRLHKLISRTQCLAHERSVSTL